MPLLHRMLSVLLGCALSVLPVNGQIFYETNPEVEWDVRVQSIREGNGVFLAPDDSLLVSTSNLGYVSGFGPKDGTEVFSYTFTPDGPDFVKSYSGVSFAPDYMVYSVLLNEDTDPTTHVVALSYTGEELWVSQALDGVSPGTPAISQSGDYVFLTHNTAGETVGHFTILDGTSGLVFFTQTNQDAPFAPLGIFHSPAEGYYDGGESNRNDVMVWSVQPKPADQSVGPGATYAFQFPIGFMGESTATLSYTQLGTEEKDFQAIQKPIFTNEGRTLYWGTSRSQFRCWIGEEGLDRYRFSRARTSILGFSRGKPPMQAVFAPLAISNNASNPMLYGGTASTEFVRLNADFSDEVLIATVSLVKTQAHVSPDDAYVYYVEFNGNVHQASAEDLMDNWVLDLGVPVEGESALSKDGTLLFMGDVTGLIQAFRVGYVPTDAPTSAPSPVPTASPTRAPTLLPTAAPTSRPTPEPTQSPMAVTPPTDPPSAPMTSPTSAPVDGNNSGAIGSSLLLSTLLLLGAVLF